MFTQAVFRFLAYLKDVRGSSEHTIRNYAADITALGMFIAKKTPSGRSSSLDELQTAIPLQSIDRQTLRAYIIFERSRNISKRSVARRLSSLRSFFRYCLREKLIEHNPMDFVESPKLDHTVPHSLSYAQIEHFFTLPDTTTFLGFRDRAIMELFYSSGLRVSELAGLNRSDLEKEEVLLHDR